MQNHVIPHKKPSNIIHRYVADKILATPKKTGELGGISVSPKDVQGLYPGVSLCPTPDSSIVEKLWLKQNPQGDSLTVGDDTHQERGYKSQITQKPRKRVCKAPPLSL